jgi:prepilin-type N-terminal cleavage/methylation domain-containing protein
LKLTRSKGFSLIEVMIALVILAVALLALAGLMATTMKNASFGGYITEAATFAQDKLEQLRAAPWTSIVAGADTRTGSTGINYSRSWAVADTVAGDQRWITITINWADPTKSTNRSVNLRSMVSQ